MSNDLIPTQQEMQTLENLSKYAMQSKFFDKVGSQGGLLSIMLYAKELGLPPMQCLFSGMHNIQGKIEISASLMNSMIRKAGHKLEILRLDNKVCSIKGTRKEDGTEYTETFAIEDAEIAGLMGNQVWKKYPKNMLFARALKNLARILFSDVIGSAYVEGEISDIYEEKPHKKFLEEAQEIEDVEEIQATVMTTEQKEDLIKKVGNAANIQDQARLAEYIQKCCSRYNIAFEDAINKWLLDPTNLLNCYNKWLDKQT